MRRGPYIFIALLAALLAGCVSASKPISQTSAHFAGANRLTNTVSPRGFATTVAFNHQGLVVSTKDALNQTTTFNYDAKGRLTNRTDTVGATLYAHDANDNLTNVMENGNTNSWTFDAYNR
ncbi:MAG: hypothetical protein ABSF34_10665, partial [Verrucomicrobiota bacterium]